MSYKIPSIPSKNAYFEEIADFWEIQTILSSPNYVSKLDVLKVLSISDDEINQDGITSEEDELDMRLDDPLKHLNERILFCNNFYPFDFEGTGLRIRAEESQEKSLYIFLLLVTRFKMNNNDNKVIDGVDGTQIFEFVCSEVAKNYFGLNSEAKVFGTGEGSKFIPKVEDLIKFIGEGKKFKNRNNNQPTKNDAGLDVVVIKKFKDQRINNLIGFGQCKTGTSWRDGLHRLKPFDFCKNYFEDFPSMHPIKMYFISDTLNYNLNFYEDQSDLLMFNRFRIMEYSGILSENVLNDLNKWNKGAIERLIKLAF